MNHVLATPWAPGSTLYSVPGRIVLKLALGEAPEHVPSVVDVRQGHVASAGSIDGGPIDRITRHFGDTPRFVRAHSARVSIGKPGKRHVGFDDLEVVFGLSRIFCVNTAPDCNILELSDALRQLSYVESAAPYYLCSLPFEHDTAAAQPANFAAENAWRARDAVNGSEALAYEPGDDAVVVALVDTGVMSKHPELVGRLRPGFDTVALGQRDLAAGMTLVGDLDIDDTDPADEVGHGTSCAGIIGASGREIPPGLAGASGLLPIRVLGSARAPGKTDPFGVGAIQDIDAGVKRAIDLGAKVINMSFGTAESSLGEGDPLPHSEVVAYGLQRGCILVAASGNSGKCERFYPAAHDGVIAVGSCGADPGAATGPASFSTSGEHVALCAPGERVMTAGLHGYQYVTGTSFAAPFVSAAAALLVSRALRRSFPLDSPTAGEILRRSAQPWRTRDKPSGAGEGMLDVHAALTLLDRVIDNESTAAATGGSP